MKRHVLMVMMAMLSAFASCKKVSDGDDLVIGVSQCSNDSWRTKMNGEMEQETLFYPGLKLDIRSANDNSQQQEADILDLIDNGVNLLVVAPNDTSSIIPAIEKARECDIPVIVVDRKIDSDNITAFIGADNFSIGKSIGVYVSKLLQNGGTVVELSGLMSSSPAQERHNGFTSIIAENPSIRLLCTRDSYWEQNAAYDNMIHILSEYDDIDVVFAHNDRMAYGAFLAAQSVGLEKSIDFIGIDALSGKGEGVKLVLDGILNATFMYPTGGDKVIQTAMQILYGEDYPKNTVLSSAIVDASNARLMDIQSRHISESTTKLKAVNDKLGELSSDYTRQKMILFFAVLVIMLIVLLLAVLLFLLHSREKMNRELVRQRDSLVQLSNELEAATQDKLTFFTNVSHEFKTPLTLISDPINRLLCRENLGTEEQYLLKTVKQNIDVLGNLVSQILDFRKYETGKQTLELSRIDLREAVGIWTSSFRTSFDTKQIRFSLSCPKGREIVIVGDRYKIERVYFNLMSNALKFTPENETIKVSVSLEDGKTACIKVYNTGSYIPEAKIPEIFKRFYTSDVINAGVGIGLALVKAYVDMHKGSVEVESNDNGTAFIIKLPVGNPETLDDAKIHSDTNELVPESMSVIGIEDEVIDNDYRQSILVVDDNEAIRSYLSSLLKENFFVIEAKNGREGLLRAMQYIPNCIVSDAMMPDMDGFELCRRIRSEVQTCHIPFILLTAYSMDTSQLEAYNVGADSYLSKPFSSDVLMARIRNLLDSRVRIKTGSDDIMTLSNQVVKDMDRDFISNLKTIIDRNLSNSEFTIDELSYELGMSRVQLYRKVKMLTNYAPNEYIRMRRLKKAQNLLFSTEMTISEVCYETGFNTPSYFTRCFKDYYNESPSDYVKRIKK